MWSFTLYKREMKKSILTLVIFAGVLTIYIPMIVQMFDPEMADILNQFNDAMPGVMAAVGMAGTATTLTGFMSSYLYGMLLLVFPMVFTILRAHGLIGKYVDRGSMVALVAAPIKRRAIAFTQMKVLASGIFLLIFYITALEIVCAEARFPGELEIGNLLLLNVGLLCLQLFIGGICFVASCIFNDAKYSVGLGAGIPTVFYLVQMLANMGGNLKDAKYLTFFTLFDPDRLIAGEASAIAGIVALFIGACALFIAGIAVFSKKDLHI
jgi:ABC-2 type transport system permease protein